jgi:hypothetical protein
MMCPQYAAHTKFNKNLSIAKLLKGDGTEHTDMMLYAYVTWIELATDGVKSWSYVNTVMNLLYKIK